MSKKNSEEVVLFPFEKIGLSLSGGGYRAALYHLGTLSYLNRVKFKEKPLLENVKIISTVSGGTITGVVYAKCLVDEKEKFEFMNFYKFLKNKIFSMDLVRNSLEYLKDDSKFKNQFKSKNLINAFAELYDEQLTQGQTFQIFNRLPNTHLKGLVINSTEFKHGINFRFVNLGSNSRRLFGNKMFKISRLMAQEVKLSDAIAASSCFPGGFEPIIWPKDFKHDNSPNLNESSKDMEDLGLMDGGIYDNQGISALTGIKDLSLIIVSDVSSPYISKYIENEKNEQTRADNFKDLSINFLFNKIRSLSEIFTWIIGILLVAGLILFCFSNNFWKGFILGVDLILLVALLLKIFLFEKKIRGLWRHIEENIINKIPTFFKIKINQSGLIDLPLKKIEPLMINRAKSLIILSTEVFLKNIRRLNYDRLFNDKKFENKRIASLIRELTWADYFEKYKLKRNNSASISEDEVKKEFQAKFEEKLPEIAKKAAEFGTTLWFADEQNKEEMMNSLIASGQFNICFNLLEYLNKILINNSYQEFFEKNPDVRSELESMKVICSRDWENFKENPMHLL